MKFQKVLTVLLTAFVFVQCGGGGGGGARVTLPKNDLKGTYHLKTFEVQYADGFSVNNTDFPHWAGTLKISSNTVQEMFNLDGDISEANDLYTVQFDDQNHDSGIFLFGDGSSLEFSVSGLELESLPTGTDPTHGFYQEVDLWVKVGDGY